MSDANSRPASELLAQDPAPEAGPGEEGPEPEIDQDRLTHLLLTAWTLVLEEEQRKQ